MGMPPLGAFEGSTAPFLVTKRDPIRDFTQKVFYQIKPLWVPGEAKAPAPPVVCLHHYLTTPLADGCGTINKLGGKFSRNFSIPESTNLCA